MKQILVMLGLLLSNLACLSSAIASETRWKELGGGMARIVAIKDPETNRIDGMVEIQLNEGWKTYWRSPGDSGIAPVFNFAGSRFVDIDKVAYPFPEIIKIPDSLFMGYHGNVRFVFSGTTYSDDAELSLNLLIGVCKEICIPAAAEFTIDAASLNTSDPAGRTELDLAKSLIPRLPGPQFKILSATPAAGRLAVTAALPRQAEPAILLVEGPDSWFSGPVNVEETQNSFTIEMPAGFNEKKNWGSQFRYTIIAGNQAIEGYLDEMPTQ